MEKSAQERYLDNWMPPNFEWPFGRTVRDELRMLCAEGSVQVRNGKFGALEFNLFNVAEAEFVKSYMDEHYPDVPYKRNWFSFEDKRSLSSTG